MVFSSISADLDPSNWQQPQYQEEGFIWSTLHHGNSIVNQNNSNPLLLPPQPPPLTNGPMGGPGPITRPISMVVKCPRCESTNTKFCYYNNRSLSQPRHLCRSCRRHWTHGGTLRPVPIGGARRKNKRSKSSSSSSGASSTATLVPAPVLGLTDYHGGVNYSVNGFKMESFNNNGSVRVEQWRILAPPEQPPQFPFELEDELSSFEIGHVIGSNELEEIGQVDDEFGNAYFN